MRLAIIENGVVLNVIIANSVMAGSVLLADNSPVSQGWTYDGTDFTAPVIVDITHLTDFDSKILLNEFTSDEAIAAQVAGGEVQAQFNLLGVRTKPISHTDQGYIDALAGFLTTGVITQTRHDDLLLGVPV